MRSLTIRGFFLTMSVKHLKLVLLEAIRYSLYLCFLSPLQELSKEHGSVFFPSLKSSLSNGSCRLVSISHSTSLSKEEGCLCCKDTGGTDSN